VCPEISSEAGWVGAPKANYGASPSRRAEPQGAIWRSCTCCADLLPAAPITESVSQIPLALCVLGQQPLDPTTPRCRHNHRFLLK